MEQNHYKKDERQSRKTKKIISICLVVVAIIGISIGLYLNVGEYGSYRHAMKFLANGQYQLAGEAFGNLEDYRDSEEKETEAYYNLANQYYDEENYELACTYYIKVADYADAPSKLKSSYYGAGQTCEDANSYEQAAEFYEKAGEFSDAPLRAANCWYSLAKKAQEKSDFEEAIIYFEKVGDKLDIEKEKNQYIYDVGDRFFNMMEYEKAQTYFDKLGSEIEEYGVYHFPKYYDSMVYISECARAAQPEIKVKISDLRNYYNDEVSEKQIILEHAKSVYGTVERSGNILTITPSYYVGVRVIAAWENNDLESLSEEEKEVYDVAVSLVEQAKSETTTEFETEKWIYDWLGRNVKYADFDGLGLPETWDEGDEVPLSCTAYGALISKKTLCQGYADAFYLLGSLAGYDVECVVGTAEEERHMWNRIFLGGQWYFVDPTCSYVRDKWNKNFVLYEFLNFTDVRGSDRYPDIISIRSKLAKTRSPRYNYYDVYDAEFETLEEATDYAVTRLVQDGILYSQMKITGVNEEIGYDELLAQMIRRMGSYKDVYSVKYYQTCFDGGVNLTFEFKSK